MILTVTVFFDSLDRQGNVASFPCRFRLSKNFDALPIQADQDKRKQENAVGANIDQLTIYRYGA